jgi:hypothetical protein
MQWPSDARLTESSSVGLKLELERENQLLIMSICMKLVGCKSEWGQVVPHSWELSPCCINDGGAFGIMGVRVQVGSLGIMITNMLIVPAPGNYGYRDISWMMIGRRNRSTQRKPAPIPLCPPQTPHACRTQTRAAAVGSQRLTSWATARPQRRNITSYRTRNFYSGVQSFTCRWLRRWYFFILLPRAGFYTFVIYNCDTYLITVV